MNDYFSIIHKLSSAHGMEAAALGNVQGAGAGPPSRSLQHSNHNAYGIANLLLLIK